MDIKRKVTILKPLKAHPLSLVFLCIGLSSPPAADDRQWSFDEPAHRQLSVLGGEVTAAPGVRKQSLVFDGASLLRVKDSGDSTHHTDGFTLAIWVNPYSSNSGQEMIAAKNR